MEDTNVKKQAVRDTATELVASNKGLLAMDESTPTCNKRFTQFGIPETAEARRDYRALILTTPDLSKYISGAILYDETIRQQASDGSSFIDLAIKAGIIPGIKVDLGTTDMAGFPGEKITMGLDGLRDRLNEYAGMGLRFAKWRAVISIGNGIPTETCIATNMQILAQYAALCQEAGIMPIVEPEVLMHGEHSIKQCFEVTEKVLKGLFDELYKQRVDLEGMLLKPNMVLAGKNSIEKNSVTEVAEATVKCLLRCVPAAVPGIAFLSGGQDGQMATNHLNEMNRLFKSRKPWALTFSFSRAIQLPVLDIWKGKEENRVAAQTELLYRAKGNSDARWGEYDFAVMPERAPGIFK
jgi:fructose-bisphosphate aldolase class I